MLHRKRSEDLFRKFQRLRSRFLFLSGRCSCTEELFYERLQVFWSVSEAGSGGGKSRSRTRRTAPDWDEIWYAGKRSRGSPVEKYWNFSYYMTFETVCQKARWFSDCFYINRKFWITCINNSRKSRELFFRKKKDCTDAHNCLTELSWWYTIYYWYEQNGEISYYILT